MSRLFHTHPVSVFDVVPSDQAALPLGDSSPFERLTSAAFRDGASATPLNSGAVVLEDYRSTEFGPANCEFGEYVVWSLRMDSRRVPPTALKLEMDGRLAQELAAARENGRSFISRARKREIKEQCALKLMARTPPAPKVLDCWWNTKTNKAYMTGRSNAEIAAFNSVFTQAFYPAFELRDEARTSAAGDAMLRGLWRSKSLRFSDGYVAELDDTIVIAGEGAVVRGTSDEPVGGMAEIAAGLRDGKTIREASVLIGHVGHGEMFRARVTPLLFPLPSLTIPTEPHAEEEFAGALMEQIDNVERACRLIEELAQSFTRGENVDIKEAA